MRGRLGIRKLTVKEVFVTISCGVAVKHTQPQYVQEQTVLLAAAIFEAPGPGTTRDNDTPL